MNQKSHSEIFADKLDFVCVKGHLNPRKQIDAAVLADTGIDLSKNFLGTRCLDEFNAKLVLSVPL